MIECEDGDIRKELIKVIWGGSDGQQRWWPAGEKPPLQHQLQKQSLATITIYQLTTIITTIVTSMIGNDNNRKGDQQQQRQQRRQRQRRRQRQQEAPPQAPPQETPTREAPQPEQPEQPAQQAQPTTHKQTQLAAQQAQPEVIRKVPKPIVQYVDKQAAQQPAARQAQPAQPAPPAQSAQPQPTQPEHPAQLEQPTPQQPATRPAPPVQTASPTQPAPEQPERPEQTAQQAQPTTHKQTRLAAQRSITTKQAQKSDNEAAPGDRQDSQRSKTSQLLERASRMSWEQILGQLSDESEVSFSYQDDMPFPFVPQLHIADAQCECDAERTVEMGRAPRWEEVPTRRAPRWENIPTESEVAGLPLWKFGDNIELSHDPACFQYLRQFVKFEPGDSDEGHQKRHVYSELPPPPMGRVFVFEGIGGALKSERGTRQGTIVTLLEERSAGPFGSWKRVRYYDCEVHSIMEGWVPAMSVRPVEEEEEEEYRWTDEEEEEEKKAV